MDREFCAFSGHRLLPREAASLLPKLLQRQIVALAEEGCTGFLCGGALGFDTLAAEAVLGLREQYPELFLSLAVPCPDQDRSWPAEARRRYRAILEAADETVLISDHYHRGCMMLRNRYMIDRSRMLVCYLTDMKGGTAGTVRYALQQNLPVVNLALEIQNTEE